MRHFLLLIILLLAAPAHAQSIEVVDGDTIIVGGEDVRLTCLDAPELSQFCYNNHKLWACGQAATEALEIIVGDGTGLVCTPKARDVYGRLLADCTVHGASVASLMVGKGWARAGCAGSRANEKAAAAARAGMWRDYVQVPKDYRALVDIFDIADRSQPYR